MTSTSTDHHRKLPICITTPPAPSKQTHEATILNSTLALLNSWLSSMSSLTRRSWNVVTAAYACTASCVHPAFLNLLYITVLSVVGSGVLFSLPARGANSTNSYLDLLYMATSATSVAGLNSVDMERFSDAQILVLTLLMFLGGEIFVSLLSLLLHRDPTGNSTTRRQQAKKELAIAILSYLAVFHIAGSLLVFCYLHASSSARAILQTKRLGASPFVLCAVVSSFANVGILANNENMAAFVKSPGLSLLLALLMLGGGVLYPAFLRVFLWLLEKVNLTRKSKDLEDLLNTEAVKYRYIFPRRRTTFLVFTVVGLFSAQLLLLCFFDWNSPAFDDLTSSEKLAASAFQSVSMRHAGEGAIDFSLVSPAMDVIFIVMMYLPTYTTFLPGAGGPHDDVDPKEASASEAWEGKMGKLDAIVKDSNLSQISYLTLFVVLVCVVERRRMSEDPLNFTVFAIAFEVVSAYGNVGLSMGYSCGKRLSGGSCKDGWYSFSGRWSPEGKLLMIFLMVFGRLKKFHMGGGKAWKLGIPSGDQETADRVEKQIVAEP